MSKEITIYQALLSKGIMTEIELHKFIIEVEMADMKIRATCKADRVIEKVVYGDPKGSFVDVAPTTKTAEAAWAR